MTTYSGSIPRAVELDDVVLEIAEALKWLRKRNGINLRNPEIENKVAWRLAVGCIKYIHNEIHKGPNKFHHSYMSECRAELLKRAEELRHTEVRELMFMAMSTNPMSFGQHDQYLDLD
jgi:hypothetical protein